MPVYVDEFPVYRRYQLFVMELPLAPLHRLARELGAGVTDYVHDPTFNQPWRNVYWISEAQRKRALDAGAQVMRLREFLDQVKKIKEARGATANRT